MRGLPQQVLRKAMSQHGRSGDEPAFAIIGVVDAAAGWTKAGTRLSASLR